MTGQESRGEYQQQHTPGPWTVYRWADDEWICIDAGPEDSRCITEVRGFNPEGFANADLIAAAPDLLAALEALSATARTFRNVPLAEQEWTPSDDEALDAAFTAIAKARGGN